MNRTKKNYELLSHNKYHVKILTQHLSTLTIGCCNIAGANEEILVKGNVCNGMTKTNEDEPDIVKEVDLLEASNMMYGGLIYDTEKRKLRNVKR